MRDTPRTDAEYDNALEFEFDSEDRLQGMRRFSKKLERELNAANAKIKRLYEEGDKMAEWLEDMRNLGADACLSHAWREAKEAKP